ncbi:MULTISPECIES: CPP1-like family protein [Cyanophyceae]|uniref:CPP1-like family protein n=1 Tax=Cyanophyceae TaxID=3028117 RepID=UPI001687F3D7|nr:CPP1-like family protein [Trichocoleus sp. FACHB-40]MBD2005658.1 CPP1-like family protein [Trichocoleus sp. FACHB-40]
MSEQNPYEKLGLTEDSTFEEIQEARSRLLQEHHGEKELLETMEAAYDAILMERLKMRQEGRIKVPERIRFPERREAPAPNFAPPPVNRSGAWLSRLVDTPSLQEVIWPSGLFLLLSGVSLLYPGTNDSMLPMNMALGAGLTLFFVNRKERKFGRAVLLTLFGLLVGIGLGTLFNSLLLEQISSIGVSANQFEAIVTFIILWLVSSFLR